MEATRISIAGDEYSVSSIYGNTITLTVAVDKSYSVGAIVAEPDSYIIATVNGDDNDKPNTWFQPYIANGTLKATSGMWNNSAVASRSIEIVPNDIVAVVETIETTVQAVGSSSITFPSQSPTPFAKLI